MGKEECAQHICIAAESDSVKQTTVTLCDYVQGGFSSYREVNCSLNSLKSLYSTMIEANQWKLSVTAVDVGKKQRKTARYKVNAIFRLWQVATNYVVC